MTHYTLHCSYRSDLSPSLPDHRCPNFFPLRAKTETKWHRPKAKHLLYCTVKMHELNEFLAEIAEGKVQDWLLAASETSYSYQIKLLLMTDDQQLTYDRVQQEYNLDPRYSLIVNIDCLHNTSCLPEVDSNTVVKIFGSLSEDGDTVSGYSGSTLAHLVLKLKLKAATVVSIDGTTTTNFQHDFMRDFRFKGIKVVLETSQGDEHMYQMMGEMDRVSEYRTLKRPVDHTIQYDHQQILVMEDNPIVRTAAGFLYDKHPATSSLYILDEHHKPKLIHGDPEPLSADSRLVLVGHGVTNNGGTSVAGYNAKELAEIIGETYRIGGKIKTVSMASCDVGSDKTFIETLMKGLHEINIETELHLRNTEVQVSHTGEKYTLDFGPNGLEWRHKDDRKQVVATNDREGNLVIRELTGNTGEAIFTSERNSLRIPSSKNYSRGWRLQN
ncbi:Multifunctional-autoprocessing repeats-in-toxin [Merluccius polli]|uniref:Multifunctional-autoprocessing repeats-in-toxin n=1 Tax=Merluccius polli TaxID=89951 RepID=A0AA47NR12_MERPO|nr:Multifunctional-autoprocessing repeats-in-toxin [Merluccius polli]